MVFGMNEEKKPPCPKGCGPMKMLFRTVMVAGDEIRGGNVAWDPKKGFHKSHGDYFDPMLGTQVNSKSHKRKLLAERGLNEVGNEKRYGPQEKTPTPWKVPDSVRRQAQAESKLKKR